MNYFTDLMRLSIEHATRSTDPSTQNAALLVRDDGPEVEAVNAFPVGVTESPERWERPQKYDFVEHAERAVIYEAARRGLVTQGRTMVCPWAACADCARAIVGAGIRRLVRQTVPEAAHWGAQVAVGDTILREAGVEVCEVPLIGGPKLRRNGELVAT